MQTKQALSSEKTTSDDLKLNGNISDSVDFIFLTTEFILFYKTRGNVFTVFIHALGMAIMKPDLLKIL
jgi:hypothetical protein